MAIEEEKDIEIPNDGDENFGEGAPKKKREKKRKSKEERIKERKVVFWTLLIILIITVGFWAVPKVREIFKGEPKIIEEENGNIATPANEKKESKNYVEITL